jgi:hypothetical protein
VSKKKRNQLTALETRFIRELMKEPASNKEAYIAAGGSPNSAKQGAHQALEKIKLRMPEIMEKLGLTAEVLVETYLKPELNATEIKVFHHQGNIFESRELIAHDPRIRALDIAFKLRGDYAPKQIDFEPGGGNVNVLVDMSILGKKNYADRD